jgi:hypothetical protein
MTLELHPSMAMKTMRKETEQQRALSASAAVKHVYALA